jgi:anti-sigma regulatory factor (Ser/Thr protein kinase)
LTASVTDAPQPRPLISLQLHGGSDAPQRARSSVRSRLGGLLAKTGAEDAMLIISELVTNSVLHAKVGPGETVTVECRALPDHLRIIVTDPGSHLQPHLRSPGGLASGGQGLRLVDALCSTWGVMRGPAGATSVWCELPTRHLGAATPGAAR